MPVATRPRRSTRPASRTCDWASPPGCRSPLVLTALEIELGRVLDLTDGRVRRALLFSRDRMLAEPWWLLQDRGEEAPTQAIGRLARDFGFVGLIAPSAARPRGANVVVFPDRLAPADRLVIVNPERLPPSPE
jgi:RES domain-containing protein